MRILLAALFVSCLFAGAAARAADFVVYEGTEGLGKGKHLVFLSGDEEYRSEEALPQLAKILAVRHGFKCTVIFSIDQKTGTIDPTVTNYQPGLEQLATADAIVMLLRFRAWPDAEMKYFEEAYLAGKPIIALRTSTHAFNYPDKANSPFAKYSFNSRVWPGGFGKQVLGETWVAHHGGHKSEATRGIVEKGAEELPIMNGVEDIFGDTDVYTASPPDDAQILVRGQVLKGMKPSDPPVEGAKNNPMQPVAWTRLYKNEAGNTNRIFTTTMGSSTDLQNEGLRRLIVNAVFWGLGMEQQIPEKADVRIVGEYKPLMYGFGAFKKGVRPDDLRLGKETPATESKPAP